VTERDQVRLAQPGGPDRRPPSAPAAVGADVPVVGALGAVGAGGILLLLAALLLLLSGWHLTQGTSGVGLVDLWGLLTGDPAADATTRDILWGSRIPRLAAGIAVGWALGVAGALFQSLARNALASPDTLAVTGGAYLAVTVVAAFGVAIPLWASGGVAFAGGLLAAGLVLGLAGGAGTSTTRLVLAGSAVALGLQAGTSVLLLLFQEETTSLYAWGSGSLSQLGLTAFTMAAPVVVLATAAGILLARRLDLLGLGDDTASVLGVPVRSTRVAGVLLAVVLTAAAVTLAGPIGFVGLCAPVIARLLGRLVPALHRHAVLVPAAGLIGAVVVVGSDAVIRRILGAEQALSVPTGIATTVVGAIVLVLLARASRDAGPTRRPATAVVGVRSRRWFLTVLVAAAVLVTALAVVGLLVGETMLRLGDIVLWLQGHGHPVVQFALDERTPRVLAALVAGAALALAGSLIQATSRNPLAEPGLLGITGGAGLAAVVIVTQTGLGPTAMVAAAAAGAFVAFATVYGISWRGGLDADRLVLVGIGVWYLGTSLTTFLLIHSDPWNTPQIYTWLSGTTYGRTFGELVPLLVALALALPVVVCFRRELDLLAVDEDTPRLVGIPLERVRLLILLVAAALAAMSVSAVGVVAFVGLVSPHMARALVGGRHTRSVPVAILVGAALLLLADLLGRTLIAPAQIPAGLMVAVIGAPYFVYLLARSRA